MRPNRTVYLGAIEVDNGYAGDKATLFLCQEIESGKVLAVSECGYFTWQERAA